MPPKQVCPLFPIFLTSVNEERYREIYIHLSRFELERMFPDEIQSKCRIELFDGLCPLENFVREVPLSFNGVIDFTVCNSELVGKFVKKARQDCLVITNRFVTFLKFRLILLKGIIKLLLSESCNTDVDTVINLRQELP